MCILIQVRKICDPELRLRTSPFFGGSGSMEREKRLEDKISRQSVVQTLKGTVYVIFRPLFFLLKSTSIWAHNEPAKTTFLVLQK